VEGIVDRGKAARFGGPKKGGTGETVTERETNDMDAFHLITAGRYFIYKDAVPTSGSY
jgi:hypothetical protein